MKYGILLALLLCMAFFPISHAEITNQSTGCVILGGAGPNPSLGPNDPNAGRDCCSGLTLATLKYAYNDNCGVNIVGYGSTCIKCGDGVCDPTYENKCNCAQDCPAKNCSKVGELCGGSTGTKCCNDMTCSVNGNYPDDTGVCITKTPVCGNHLCESGEANSCPACTQSTPPCMAPCTIGTCPGDCNSVCTPLACPNIPTGCTAQSKPYINNCPVCPEFVCNTVKAINVTTDKAYYDVNENVKITATLSSSDGNFGNVVAQVIRNYAYNSSENITLVKGACRTNAIVPIESTATTSTSIVSIPTASSSATSTLATPKSQPVLVASTAKVVDATAGSGGGAGVICPAVCRPLWMLADNKCTSNSCGSGCGADNLQWFNSESECKAKIITSGSASATSIISTSTIPKSASSITSSISSSTIASSASGGGSGGISCPLISTPSPTWCTDGKIVSGGTDSNGCQLAPKCVWETPPSLPQTICDFTGTYTNAAKEGTYALIATSDVKGSYPGYAIFSVVDMEKARQYIIPSDIGADKFSSMYYFDASSNIGIISSNVSLRGYYLVTYSQPDLSTLGIVIITNSKDDMQKFVSQALASSTPFTKKQVDGYSMYYLASGSSKSVFWTSDNKIVVLASSSGSFVNYGTTLNAYVSTSSMKAGTSSAIAATGKAIGKITGLPVAVQTTAVQSATAAQVTAAEPTLISQQATSMVQTKITEVPSEIISAYLKLLPSDIDASAAIPGQIEVKLKRGWNLISFPFGTGNTLTSPDGSCVPTTSFTYDSKLGKYIRASGKDSLNKYTAWVKVANDCSLYATIRDADLWSSKLFSEYNLDTGWNLIGGATKSIAFGDIQGTCSFDRGPYKFNAASNNWEMASSMEPGFGYAVRLKTACSLGTADETPPPLPQI